MTTTNEATQRDELAAAIAETLDPDITVCTRAWEAWSYGTMGSDDFTPLSEDPDSLLHIAEGLIASGCRKPVVLGYVVVDRDGGMVIGSSYATRDKAQSTADWWTSHANFTERSQEYRVAEIVEATR